MKRNKEDTISMFLGLIVVILFGYLVVKFVQKNKGRIDIPGIMKFEKKDEEKAEEVKEMEKIIVVKGQTLWQIAEDKYQDGHKWVEIAKENKIENPSLIEVGHELVLPIIENKGEIEKEVPTEYKVVKGDSLWKIATQFYNDGYQWTKIWQNNRNKLNSPDRLEIGMTLTL